MATLTTPEGILVTDGALSADVTTDQVYVADSHAYCVRAVWTATGSPVGTLYLQASIDGTNFESLDSGEAISAAGSKMWNVADVAYSYFRLFYDSTSGGTGATLNAYYRVKK